ncbi:MULTISPECIES: tripartite tricarboxylate transporter substrate-binding protein [unclassified Beijerinckia]|uniref:Bug family tripartite tricarboxylate transporter substrate binding protein n=1 Tax=unclassified Beijerinckia TaxID=2638183 RepID=UPI00089B4544|nr:MULTISPECIES: tripartite tricarboxylate transporter substrate-binding protein [unclassified Beijerinckia]MDH7795815.1 tripartite-type tricarboxylate transporter receptor subunit TctC [Beijerinckia sp. GAS462]SEC17561.1 Tripartite-type tricarboxylate transporter, receptor component TctC [Beijerinckia sp. 28-YEA-48]
MRIGVLALTMMVVAAGSAQAQSDFYRGKQLKIVVGSEVGGGFSSYAQLLSTHFGKYIPGNPAVVIEHRPGSGGVNAIDYVANAGAKDGTIIAVAMPNFFVTPFVEPKAAKFDPAKFHFIGRMSDFGRALVAWHSSGVTTLDDLKAKETVLATSARRSTTTIQPVLINEILGTKMKIVPGFMGSGPTAVALEQGEVQVSTIAYSTLQSLHPDWLRDKKINIIAGLDFSDIPGVVKIRDLIDDPQKKAMWDFVALPSEFGTAYVVSPGVPDERIAILRQAFDATMKSEEMIADARKRNLDLNPKSGEALDQLFAKAGSPTPEIIKHVGTIMGVN